MNKRRSEKGQSLVEFGATLTVLIIVLAGVVDIGRAYFTFIAIENGAGEGALFAAHHPTWVTESDSTSSNPQYDNIEYRAAHESPNSLVDWSRATVTVEYSDPATIGEPITVTVSYEYDLLTPFISSMASGGSLTLGASATQRILNLDEP